MGTQTNITAAMILEAGVHIVLYVIEAIVGIELPESIEASAAVLALSFLYFIPADFPLRKRSE